MGSGLGPSSVHRDVALRTIQVQWDEAGDVGSGPTCTTNYLCDPEEVTSSLQASTSSIVK